EKLVRIWLRRADSQRGIVQFVDFQDGTRGGIRARYLAISDRWLIWYLALDGETVFGPIKVVPGIDLFAGRRHDPRVPRGQLFVYSPDRAPPTKTSIDVSAVLYYRRAAA